MASFQQQRAEFGVRLRQLRLDAGLSAKNLAARVGWDPPKLSKIETGKQTATGADLAALIDGLHVPADVADELSVDLDRLWTEYSSWKAQVRAGHRARQERSVEVEAGARLIRAVDIGIVPGLVQTPEYARHALLAHAGLHGGGQDIDEAVRARVRRQQVLYEPGKTIEILMAESGLLHPIAPPEVMIGQIHRLIAAIGTPHLRLGILPARAQLPYMLTHGYWIVDDLVQIELVSGELPITDPDEVATYNRLTDVLWPVALEGEEARVLLLRLLNEYLAGDPPAEPN